MVHGLSVMASRRRSAVMVQEYGVCGCEGATCKQTLSIIDIDRTNSG